MTVQGTAKQLDSERSEGDDGTVTYSVRYRVTTERGDGPAIAATASGLPQRGDTYSYGNETDPFASCRNRSIACESFNETAKLWIVTCSYSTKGSSQDPGQNGSGTDPINWNWTARLDTWARMEAPDFDRNNRALVNAVWEPFLPPPERENPDPLIILEKNHPTINLTQWAEAQGKVDSVALWGLPANRMVKLRKWTADPHWVGPGFMYWRWKLEVEVKFARWFFQPPNLGHREFVGVNPATGAPIWREIVDENWHPLARPVPLDAIGQKLPAGVDPLFFDQAAGPLRRFELEDEYDLSTILPATLPGNFTI